VKKENNNTIIDKIWNFFTSVKLAIIIFPLISLVSIIGTLVDQQAEPGENVALLAKFFGDTYAPTVYNIFAEIGFIDMYSSWWYIALLVLLAVNITVCSIDRLPKTIKIIKEPLRPFSNDRIGNLPIRRSFVLNGSLDSVIDTLRNALRNTGFKITEFREDKNCRLCSQKGRWSRIGVYITHAGVLVTMMGVVSGVLFSEESYLSLPEGDTSSVSYPIPDSDRPDPNPTPIPLGFEIRCDNFEVEFYGDGDLPKSFISQVTVLEEGKEVLRKTVQVNDPLKYRGTTFYLSDYGVTERRLNRGTFIFRVTSRDGRYTDIRLTPGNVLEIPGTNIIGKVINFSPALIHDEEGKLSTYTEKLHNPAVHIDFSDPNGHLYSSWIFKRFPERSYLPDGNRIEFIDYWGVEYTFFRIRKDPGVWLVYLGLITMGIGLIIAFFMSHKRIWVNLIEEEMNTKVVIGATANKYGSTFEAKIDRLINKLSENSQP
jgi:cytochrome c biogenesis protein